MKIRLLIAMGPILRSRGKAPAGFSALSGPDACSTPPDFERISRCMAVSR